VAKGEGLGAKTRPPFGRPEETNKKKRYRKEKVKKINEERQQ